MGLRDLKENNQEKNPFGLAKTSATANLISVLMTSLLGMFQAVNLRKSGGGDYVLPVSLSFLIPAVIIMALSIFCLFNIEKKKMRLFTSILSLVSGVLIALGGIPMLSLFGSLEFLLVLIGLGICVLAIGIATLLSVKEE